MTLPASGQISFFDINVELGRTSTATIGLDEAENGTYATINRCGPNWPSSGNPAAISEWYNYNHTFAPLNFGTFDDSLISCANACGLSVACSVTLYTASGAYYINNNCTTPAGDGVTTYYADCARTNCYTILNGSLSSTTACTTTTTTTTTTTNGCECVGNTCSFACDNAFCFCFNVSDCISPSSCI